MKLTLPFIVLTAIAIVGCAPKKKKAPDTSPMPAAGTVLNVPTAPAASYTPPPAPQPIVQETPQQREQPVMQDAVVDASDNVAINPAPARAAAPVRQVAHKPAAQRSSAGTKYTIKKGESLWSIAQDKYGDGNKWKKIAAANPKLDPDHVMAGQTIVLP